MYNVIITVALTIEALFQPKIHYMSFGGRAPRGPANEELKP